MAGWRWWKEVRVDKISPTSHRPSAHDVENIKRSHGLAKVPLYTWNLFRTLIPLLSLIIMAVHEIVFLRGKERV
jgi:hypothetical protein